MDGNKSYLRLIEKINSYTSLCDISLIDKAYEMSKTAHRGQQRLSGEPYISHPVEVANILADLELDCTTIIAAILHDNVEDTDVTMEQIKINFGEDVARLVDGVTKLEKIPYTTKEEQQAENLRKMFLAMAKDIRVILIKLADRLHNMRTLKSMTLEKQKEKAEETLEIYAPLAHRLGMSKIKWELEDLCLRYIDPEAYYDLVNKIAIKRKERESYINDVIETLKVKTVEIGIEANVEGRPKHFYSIYKKMQNQNKTIEQIYDLFALRVIVNTVHDCYAVLGLVHELYKPMPGRFKDYIAMPKPNMYQSLHTTLIGPGGQPVEIQIRTWDMHKIAEVGIAAHWRYKEGDDQANENMDQKLAWLRQLLDWQKEMRDAKEFMETLKIDLFTDEVFIFTPKGDVINLAAGSTPIDFAYAIHSAVGNSMMGAKINGKIVPLEYSLKNGDIVEILTSSNVKGPRFDWLKIVKSSQAKNKINQWFKKQKREENIQKGKEIIEKELKKQGFTFNQLFKTDWLDPILKKYTINTIDDMYSLIGYGAITPNKIISKLKDEYKKTIPPEEDLTRQIENLPKNKSLAKKKRSIENGVIVSGIDNCLVRISKCCNPVPGDEIIGYITRGRGVSVHRKDCGNVIETMESTERLIDVRWYTAENVSYPAELIVIANDFAGLLILVTNAITDLKIPLKAVNARTTKDREAFISLTIEINGTEQLDRVISKLRKIKGIISVKRSNHKIEKE